MHSLWNFFLTKQQFSWLLIVSLIGAGIFTVVAIPKESAPEVIIPVGIITTVYPGAPARDMEELVTARIEDAVENVDNLDKLTSTSRDGVSVITASFAASADITTSIQKLKDAVDTAKPDLPRDAQDPIVSEINFANEPIFVISISSDAAPSEITKLGTDLSTIFKSVSGVSDVTVEGTRPRQIQVIISPSSLASYGVTVGEVSGALASQNLAFPVGSITAGGSQYSVRLDNTLKNVDDIKAVIVTTKNGTPIFVRDIATVVETVDTANSIARVSVAGAPAESALTLSIYKKSGVNVTSMSSEVRKKLAELQADGGLLASSQVLVVFDKGADTYKQLSELIQAGAETVVLVMISLLLTIGWRESVVAALSIPLSFVIAFIGLYASGNTINFISLFALILAVGILVDSGIVVTEAIHTRLKRSGDALLAARETINEYAWPLIAGTMTTVAVFAPLFFLSGVVGQFISSIPFTIIFVLIASIFVALGMVPLIAIILTANAVPNRFERWQETMNHRAQVWYRAKLLAFLKNIRAQRAFLWLLFVSFVFVLALPSLGLLKVIFFPPENTDFIYLDLSMVEGTPLYETDIALRRAEEILYENTEIESFSSGVGRGSAFTGGSDAGGQYANITIALKPKRDHTSAEVATALRNEFKSLKNVDVKISEQQTGPPSGAPVALKISGNDLTELAKVADKASLALSSITGVRDVSSSADTSASEFVLRVDSAKASRYGVSPLEVSSALRAAVFGVTATTIRRDGDDIDVMIKLGSPEELLKLASVPEVTLTTLRNLTISTPRGESILLASVLDDSYSPANSAITREDKKRIVTVSAYTSGDKTATEVLAEFEKSKNTLGLTPDMTLTYGGETEDINKTFTEMFVALFAGLLGMLAILVLSFNSVRYSLYLLLAVPYSLIGVFAGLALTGKPLSFTSLLGVIALAGVIINHAIILMDSLILHKGDVALKPTLADQVTDASVSRFRPIMLTTITTVVGMIPLSRVSDFWSPLAFAIMFGLSFAMVLTLILIPTLYYRNELKKEQKANGTYVRGRIGRGLHWLIDATSTFVWPIN